MPSYKGHLAGGVAAYIGMMYFVQFTDPSAHVIIQGFLFCMLGSLFPDVDTKSKGQKIFYRLLLLFLFYCLAVQKWKLFAVVSLLGVTPLLVRHRGIFHEPWFLLAVTLSLTVIFKLLNKDYESLLLANSWFFFAGCMSHVLLDRLLTKAKRSFNR